MLYFNAYFRWIYIQEIKEDCPTVGQLEDVEASA